MAINDQIKEEEIKKNNRNYKDGFMRNKRVGNFTRFDTSYIFGTPPPHLAHFHLLHIWHTSTSYTLGTPPPLTHLAHLHLLHIWHTSTSYTFGTPPTHLSHRHLFTHLAHLLRAGTTFTSYILHQVDTVSFGVTSYTLTLLTHLHRH